VSDALRAAASALGAPEAIVQRSAEARAKATGVSADEVLAVWAGGEPPPPGAIPQAAATPAPAPAPSLVPEPVQQAAATAAPTISPSAQASSTQAMPPPAPDDFVPPVLVGGRETLVGLIAGVIGLLLLSLVLGVVMPGIPEPGNGVRSSAIGFSLAGRQGRQLYLQQGCGSCHTQIIRNVVSDFGLGPVTLSDTNQVIGYRRYGPDLADIGSRMADSAVLMNVLRGADGHPAVSALNEDELANLTAYLQESR